MDEPGGSAGFCGVQNVVCALDIDAGLAAIVPGPHVGIAGNVEDGVGSFRHHCTQARRVEQIPFHTVGAEPHQVADIGAGAVQGDNLPVPGVEFGDQVMADEARPPGYESGPHAPVPFMPAIVTTGPSGFDVPPS